MSFLKLLSSEWLKTKRTAVRLIVYATPLIYPMAMLWYFSRYNSPSSWELYRFFFEVLAVCLPIIIGLLTGLISNQEERSGEFINLLTGSVSRTKFYFGKLFLLIFFAIINIFLATIIMLLGMKYKLHLDVLYFELFLRGALLTVVGSLILFAIHLFISFVFGMGASIAIGGGGFLISAIVGATVVGDNVWQFVPWAWPVRLSQVPVLLMLEGEESFEIQLSSLYYEELMKGIIPAIICFILAIITSIFWFNRWEGNKLYE